MRVSGVCWHAIGEFIYISLLQGHTANPKVDPSFSHVPGTPDEWKTHIFHTGSSQTAETLLSMDCGQEEPAPAEADRHATSQTRAMMLRLNIFCTVADQTTIAFIISFWKRLKMRIWRPTKASATRTTPLPSMTTCQPIRWNQLFLSIAICYSIEVVLHSQHGQATLSKQIDFRIQDESEPQMEALHG